MKINLITLGCSKNLVDSEKLLRQFQANGHSISHDSDLASDVVIINTCGFILDAKTESVNTILKAVQAKNRGDVSKVFVMGCLSERYRDELLSEIPEVDGFFGLNEFEKILSAIQSSYHAGLLQERYITTPGHYAYLKISEGCNRNCAFCAIPAIRGKQISQTIEDLLKEARFLAASGVKELILVAQDLTSYGTDIHGKPTLTKLLEELVKIEEFRWIRLHYTYPVNFPLSGLIELMKKHRKICRYLDMPFQHCNDAVLKKMKRGHGKDRILQIVESFRRELPGIAVRTTLITGFPGEGEKEFEELKDFVEEMKFERLGVFTYSHEEKTPAGSEFKDLIPAKTKKARLKTLHSLQEKISLEKNRNMIGKHLLVIIDGREGDYYTARTEYDSPGVDNEVLIPVENSPELIPGDFQRVEIYDALEFDLFGKLS